VTGDESQMTIVVHHTTTKTVAENFVNLRCILLGQNAQLLHPKLAETT